MLAFISVVGLYIAGVIGAGFASGQELVFFFVKYGPGALIGVCTAVFILTLGSGVVLDYCARERIQSYEGLFAVLGPGGAILFDWIYTSFLVTSISIMLAGAGAIGGTPLQAASLRLGTALLIFFVLHKGVQGVLQISSWLTPVIVILLLGISLYRVFNYPRIPFVGTAWGGVEPAFLYAFYNLSFSMAMLASTHQILKTKFQRWAAAMLGNLVLGLTMLAVVFSLGTLPLADLDTALPLLHLATVLGPIFARSFKLILWLSMYTTALSNSLILVKRITNKGLSWVKGPLLVLGGAIALSFFGFANLIRVAYPILGLAGLFLLLHIIRYRFEA